MNTESIVVIQIIMMLILVLVGFKFMQIGFTIERLEHDLDAAVKGISYNKTDLGMITTKIDVNEQELMVLKETISVNSHQTYNELIELISEVERIRRMIECNNWRKRNHIPMKRKGNGKRCC